MLFLSTKAILYREQASILNEVFFLNNLYNEIIAQHLPQEHILHFCTLANKYSVTVLYSLKKGDWFPCDCNITTCIHYFLQALFFFFQKKKVYLKEIMYTCSNVMSVHL